VRLIWGAFSEEKNLSKSSMNKVIQHFKAVFNYAFNNDLIHRNPAKNIKQFKVPEKEMDFYTKEETEIILRHTHKKYQGEERWKHVFYLCVFLTGSRFSEILELEWSNINWKNDSIRIKQQWCNL
jgi:integrase